MKEGHAVERIGKRKRGKPAPFAAVPEVPADPLAAAYARMKQAQESEQKLAECRTALVGRPNSIDLLLTAAELLRRLDRAGESVPYLTRVLEIDPGRTDIRHLLAGIGGAPVPVRADNTYVARLFDQMAENFDRTLVDMLDYKAPELVASALRAALGPKSPAAAIVDLGCGTGLCGPLMRPLAKRLDGVDLSPAMISKAKQRKCYDQLQVADMEGFLASRRYGVAVAADVLVYLGDLASTFAAVAASLDAPGLFVFTAEFHDGDAYRLLPNGRYAHAETYVRKLADGAGFAVERVEAITPRMEHGKPVVGRLYVLRKKVAE
jgi:predicted TPR repeat methyltransferase